jgi:UDP-glucose 4-epimerase
VVRALLREPGVERVVGVDVEPPPDGLGGGEFVRADIRRPAIAKVLAACTADTVVHLNVTGLPLGSAGRGTVKETNVIGTMQLLAACFKAPSVRRLVVKSTTSVYGSAARDPAVFSEDMYARVLPSGGFAKDAVEVEGYVRAFARRRPDVSVGLFRFANILGPTARTPLAEYFALPVLPTVLGFDPRLQFVHADDAVDVLRLAALDPRRGTQNDGTFNIAGDGVLLLSQAARRLGRPTFPLLLPAVTLAGMAIRRSGIGDFSPEQIRLLTHGRVVDTGRMREVFGHTPAYTTAETFADFARGRGPGLLPPRQIDRAAGLLGRVLDGVGAEREQERERE